MAKNEKISVFGEWEILFNPDFNYTEFGTIKSNAGLNSFKISVKELPV